MRCSEGAEDGWELLAREFDGSQFFLHGIGRPRQSPAALTFTTSAHYRHFCLRMVVFCLLSEAATVGIVPFLGLTGSFVLFPPVFVLFLLLLLVGPYVWRGLMVERVEFSRGRDEVRFVWGFPGRTRCVALPSASLRAVLQVEERGRGDARYAGIEELWLRSESREGGICLARARKPNALREPYDSLTAFGTVQTEDRTHADTRLPDGSTISLSREGNCGTPLSPHSLEFVSETHAEGSILKSDYLIVYMFVLLALMWVAAVIEDRWWSPALIAVVVLPLFFASPPWRRKRFALDRETGVMLFRGWFGAWQKRRFADFVALQTCTYRRTAAKSADFMPVRGSRCYELNAVEAGPRPARLTLTRTTSPDQVWREAEKLAQLMGLPLIDHAGIERAHVRVPLIGEGTARVSRLPVRIAEQVNGGGRWLWPRVRFVSDDVASSMGLLLRRLTLDRAAGLLRIPRGLRRWEERPLSDVTAVQLCQSTTCNGRQLVYEINLVMRGEDGERVTFLQTATAPEGVRWDARRVADMLGVPLLDHLTEGASPRAGDTSHDEEAPSA